MLGCLCRRSRRCLGDLPPGDPGLQLQLFGGSDVSLRCLLGLRFRRFFEAFLFVADNLSLLSTLQDRHCLVFGRRLGDLPPCDPGLQLQLSSGSVVSLRCLLNLRFRRFFEAFVFVADSLPLLSTLQDRRCLVLGPGVHSLFGSHTLWVLQYGQVRNG